MRKYILTIGHFILVSSAYSQTYTWSQNVACIFYTHCTSCHFPGGPAAFSLIDYANAFANKYDIKDAVLDGSMPPWPADVDYRSFAHERVLTQEEKYII